MGGVGGLGVTRVCMWGGGSGNEGANNFLEFSYTVQLVQVFS